MNRSLYEKYTDDAINLYVRLINSAKEANERYATTKKRKFLLIKLHLQKLRRMNDLVQLRLHHISDMERLLTSTKNETMQAEMRLYMNAQMTASMRFLSRSKRVDWMTATACFAEDIVILTKDYTALFELAHQCLEEPDDINLPFSASIQEKKTKTCYFQ